MSDLKPDTELQAAAEGILERFRERKVLTPIARVKAWDALRESIQVVSAEEVHKAWRAFKTALDTAKAGGDFDGLTELHDEFTGKLHAWLNGPCC